MKYTVPQDLPLLEALAKLAPDSSKTSLRSWLKEGRVFVNGKCEKLGTHLVSEGQVVSLGAKAKHTSEGDLKIIYEDNHIVVVDKPHGLLSVSTAFENGITAHGLLKKNYKPKKVYVVHRLDQDTSGVMLFALSEEAYIALKKMFEKHDLERSYTAIVEGKMEFADGTWRSYLYEDPVTYIVHETDIPEQGKLAITHYQVFKTTKKHSVIQLKLETGKKNQIRVHCQKAGFPIIGDKKYGAKSNPIKRLGLHAHLLCFDHPITHKKMRFESPLPEEFRKLDVYA